MINDRSGMVRIGGSFGRERFFFGCGSAVLCRRHGMSMLCICRKRPEQRIHQELEEDERPGTRHSRANLEQIAGKGLERNEKNWPYRMVSLACNQKVSFNHEKRCFSGNRRP